MSERNHNKLVNMAIQPAVLKTPEAEQMIKCPSCKQHVPVPGVVGFEGRDLCDGCAENASIEKRSVEWFEEEVGKEVREEAAYIRRHFEDDMTY